ncbi:LysR substrate-binding domain-containing protein [Vibrio sp. ZSDZ34]|jgi:DNA-binding transcriptional LysR family regulator|uniref:LysR substrate-binding domain-containing protein n=1 Tax=Vibrio gelatinilyticus TaxID=2893468 RepID=A0A9X2AWA5_9VIBR|nr:LysR substrate-binding domain-containing protein [Vibrio gelatinilyticus]MCJ2377036.1 LysR substrate-binding domain-containing protein [Vibrio gelatinilyticus]
MKMPPLRAVHCFESVARNNSFSLAATELNVTQSAISHQVRLLEEYLGEPLFIRQGPKLSLSAIGEQYLEEIGPAISSISMASERVREGDKGVLRLAIYSSMAVNWLIPNLNEFRRRHPEIELTLNMVAQDPELTDSVGDCFITVREPSNKYQVDFLYRECLYPVCSYKIWRELQDKTMPEALWNYPLLSSVSVYGTPGQDWKSWCLAGGYTLPSHVDVQHFSHILLATEAARYDQGITFVDQYMLNEKNSDQDLVRLPLHGFETGDSFYFTYKKSRAKNPDIIKLSQWLQQLCY